MSTRFIIGALICLIPLTGLTQLNGTLKYGTYPVGFRVVDTLDEKGKPFRYCIWYPAASEGSTMKLADYVEIASIGGTTDKKILRDQLKDVLQLPFVAGLSHVPEDKFIAALNSPVKATRNATIKVGKWPLIISDTEPSSLCVTTEYFASHGYVVAVPAIQYGPPGDDKTLYSAPTAGLKSLLEIMSFQSYIKPNNVYALGFGGGALAAFYLGMQTDKLIPFVNIEGGLFMPASKTTLSADYFPGKFNTPLLHIVTPDIRTKESEEEYNAVTARKYRITHKQQLRHHDFTIYGRIVNGLMNMRGQGSEEATSAFTELHEIILSFLQNNKLEPAKVNTSAFYWLD